MADNSTYDPGTGGDTYRSKDRTGVKTEIVGLDLTPGGGSETLMNGVMPVSDNSGSLTVDNGGTFAVQADTELTTADLDSGAGTDTRAVVGLVLAKSGGAANISTADPLPVLLTGTAAVTLSSDRSEDAPASSGHSGTPILAVRNDAAAVKTSADGDYSMLATDDAGRLAVTDLGGSLTVDAPVGTPAFVRLSDGAAAISTLPVSLASVPSHAVTNAGTFAVQIAANSSVNAAQVAGTATSVNSGAKDAGTQRVILASDQTVVPVSDNAGSLTVDNGGTFTVQDSEKVADDAAFTVGTTKLDPVGFLADETSTDSVDEGDLGAARMTLDRKLIVTVEPHTAGGWDTKNCTSGDGSTALTSTAQAVKASAGKLGGWFIYNPNTAAAYVPIYNVASGSVTVGTTNPLMILTIPASSAANLEMVNGITFDTAIAVAAVQTTAGGNTAPTTALEANFFYR